MKILASIFIILSLNLYSRDWVYVNPKFDAGGDYHGITCYDTLNCYAYYRGVDNSMIGKSTDQGETWFKIYDKNHFEEGNRDSVWLMFNVFTLDSNYLYYTYSDRAVLDKSTNSGYTFERVNFGELSLNKHDLLWEIAMYDRNIGAAVSKHNIIITKDNWKTYEIRPITHVKYPGYIMHFLDSNNIMISKFFRRDQIFVNYNIEKNQWTDYYLGEEYAEGEEEKEISDIEFVNDSVAYAAGWKDTISGDFAKDIVWKSTDKGKNWEIILNKVHEPKFGLTYLSFRTELHGIAVGYWGKVVETTDGGKTWTYIEPHPDLNGPGLMVDWAGEYALVSDCCSGIYRLDPWVKSIEKDIINQEKIKIRQSKDKLLISINDKKYRKHKIEIFDLQGLKLNEQSLSSGGGTLFQPVRIDQYPSGAYFFRISVGSELVYSGKFVK